MVEKFSINMPILALVSDMRDAYQIYLHFLGDNINPRPLTERGFLSDCKEPFLFVGQTTLHVNSGLLTISQNLSPDFLQAVDDELILLRSQITVII